MKAVDIIMVILTLTISIVVLIPLVNYVLTGKVLGSDGLKILDDSMAGMLSIIALYVGHQLR